MSTISISDPIYQGEGKWFSFLVVDGDDVAIDLSTATFIFQIKQSIDDLLPLYTSVEYDVSNASIGEVKANLPATQTLTMAVGTYYAQLLASIVPDTDVDISDMVKFKIKKPIVEA